MTYTTAYNDQTNSASILIVDDTPENLRLLTSMLSNQDYKIRSAISGQMALLAARAAVPDLILLDINMPEMNGYQVCRELKMNEATHDVPVIFISALNEVQDKVKAFTAGGVDYITKPFQLQEVLARVETHLDLQHLQRQLKQEIASRDVLIAELDAFAHTVAHGLNNPLASVLLCSDLLRNSLQTLTPQEIEADLDTMSETAGKMRTIIRELLLLASVRQMETINVQPLDMAAVVAETQSRLAAQIEESGAQLLLPCEWPAALGYAPWIEEVWANYLDNALKYGGPSPCIELGADQACDSAVRFWLRDQGPGISQQAHRKLFTPFERLNQVDLNGNGLGLSIVRRIVERLDGRVGVESELGAGSTFWFSLPATD